MTARKGAFSPNPLLAGMLGICPLVAADRSLSEGIVLGTGAAVCSLVIGAIAIPAREIVPDRLRAPFSLAISAAIASLYALGVGAYAPTLAVGLGVFLPLLAVSALSLHTLRRSSSGSTARESYSSIALEALAFLATAALIGALREILGFGTLTIPLPGDVPLRLVELPLAPLRTLSSASGGFILIGCLAAAYRLLLRAAGRRVQ